VAYLACEKSRKPMQCSISTARPGNVTAEVRWRVCLRHGVQADKVQRMLTKVGLSMKSIESTYRYAGLFPEAAKR
jgi:hypothetical protein